MDSYDNTLESINRLLPKQRRIKLRCESDYYGASRIISSMLKLPFTPKSISTWRHGWAFIKPKYPQQIIGNIKDTKRRFLVGTKEQVRFLRGFGYNAHAVGLPYIYADEVVRGMNIRRISGSLLVMPPHSLPYTEHEWAEEVYVREIIKLKNEFSFIAVCLHSECWNKRLWIDKFQQHNIPVLLGADIYDSNSLIRTSILFNYFENMTTNIFGSHVLYSAYSGCKVSVYGNYLLYKKEDYNKDPFYVEYPYILDYIMKMQYMWPKKMYGFLFRNPVESTVDKEWANKEIGECNKKGYLELAYLLGWTPEQKILRYLRVLKNKCISYT